jgi:phage shock protein A
MTKVNFWHNISTSIWHQRKISKTLYIMKRIALIIPLAVGAFSCSQLDLEEKIASLQEENRLLQEQTLTKDQSIAEFVESFTEIEQNLSEIRERELNIDLDHGDATASEDLRERVKEDIKVINQLMAENKQNLEELNTKIRQVSGKNATLRKALESAKQELQAQIEERDTQIAELKQELETMDFTITELNGKMDTLKLANSQQEEVILDQTGKLNTAYYATGSSKHLLAENVLTKDGGFLGLGKSEMLRDDFDSDKFSKIDITSTTTIPISGSTAELVTNHPTDSYVIEGDNEKSVDRLVIIDPDRFWYSSKYLVVVTN